MRSYLTTGLIGIVGLVFAAVPAAAAPVDFTTMQLNGIATATSNDLNLGNGVGGTSSSAFLAPISSSSSFTSSFNFTLTANPNNPNGVSPQADGITFLIQADPGGATALGGGGGGVGASGLSNNIGISFRSWDNNHSIIFTNGNVFDTSVHAFGNFNLGDQDDVVFVTLSYAGNVLSYSATNMSTGVTINDSLAFNLAGLGPSVYLGFTGGTGAGYAFQDVHDWELNVVNGVPEPATWALMIMGFGLVGATMRRRLYA